MRASTRRAEILARARDLDGDFLDLFGERRLGLRHSHPHVFHVGVLEDRAREAMRACGLVRVLFVPAYRPPHKHAKAHAPYEDRYNMVVLACRHDPAFEPSRLEEGTGFHGSNPGIAGRHWLPSDRAG